MSYNDIARNIQKAVEAGAAVGSCRLGNPDPVVAEARAAALREAIEAIRPMTDWDWWYANHPDKSTIRMGAEMALAAVERLLNEEGKP